MNRKWVLLSKIYIFELLESNWPETNKKWPAQIRYNSVIITKQNNYPTGKNAVLRTCKGRPLSTSWERLLPTSSGLWNITSWRRLHICPTCNAMGSPIQTSPAGVMGTSPYDLICNSNGHVLRTSPKYVSRMS